MQRNIWNIFCLFLLTGNGIAEDVVKAPEKVQATIFLKLLPFNKNINGGGDVTIIVVNGKAFADLITKAEGKPVGKSKLTKVITVDAVPTDAPANPNSVIYLGNKGDLDNLIAYSTESKIENYRIVKNQRTRVECSCAGYTRS